MHILEKIHAILVQAKLSDTDTQFWYEYFDTAPDEAQTLFLTLFTNNQSDLAYATENLRQKLAAGADQEKIEQVLEADKKSILETT